MLLKVLVLSIIASTFAHLPSYIKVCSRKDPNLNDCCLKRAKEVYPNIVKGSKELEIPPLNPLILPQVSIEGGKEFQLVLKDVVVDGLQDGEVQAVDFDLEKQRVKLKIFSKKVTITSDYNVNGKVLLVSIAGEGKCKIEAVGATLEYIYDFKLIEKNGEQHGQVVSDNLEIKLEGANFHFGDLFGDDKKLSEQFHKTINDNWKDVTDSLGAPIKKTIEEIAKSIIQKMMNNITYAELFSD